MSTEITQQEPQNSQTELSATRPERFIRPTYNVTQSEDAYEVTVVMPGVSKDGLSVTLDKGDLLIEGTKTNYREPSWQVVHQEISDANYRLRLQLNITINEGEIKARIEDGILKVTLPVAEEAKPKRIAVE